jgi:hypothetical protein
VSFEPFSCLLAVFFIDIQDIMDVWTHSQK